jgi:hypothetical protein
MSAVLNISRGQWSLLIVSVLTFSRMAAAANAPPVSESKNGASDIFGKFSSKFSDTLQTAASHAGVSGGLDSFISGVKNVMRSKKELTVTRAVDAFMEGGDGKEFEDWVCFDPRVSKSGAGKKGGVHNDAIVFVVGGGNFLEHQNLVDFAQV